MLPKNKILALAVPLAACALAAHAADNKITIENRMAQCQGCHGIPNWKTAFPEVYRVPKLGGQKAGYIAAALKEYKSGDRDFATMRAIAADLSDADIEQLARYYGSDSALEAAAPLPAAAPASAPAAASTAPAAAQAPAAASSSAPASTTPASGAPSTAASPAPATGAMPAASASGNSSTAASTSKGGKK